MPAVFSLGESARFLFLFTAHDIGHMHMPNQIKHLVGIANFIVIPCDEFDESVVER